MITQRWRDRRDHYRSQGDAFHPEEYGVEPIALDRPAKAFVETHHYSASYPAARCRIGLYRKRIGWFAPELVGVAVFSVPMQQGVIPHYAPGLSPAEGIEMGRFVLLDEVPFNAESWFLARARRWVRELLPEVRVLISYSDPLPRQDAAGRTITPGHVGTIYQAGNATYHGQAKGRRHWLTPAGTFLSERGLSKVRNQERGWEGVVSGLISMGAPGPAWGRETPEAWVARILREGPFTAVWHPGNHVYSWPLSEDCPKVWAPSKAYPKRQIHPTCPD